MALHESTHNFLYEESQVSSQITENGAEKFFQEHGVFYESNSEIGRLAATINPRTALHRSSGLDEFKKIYMEYPVSPNHIILLSRTDRAPATTISPAIP